MSAFIVGQTHIEALVALGQFGPSGDSEFNPNLRVRWCENPNADWQERSYRDQATIEDCQRIGTILQAENIASVTARYPNDPPEQPNEFRFSIPKRRPSVVEGLKAIMCYEYQSCEHEGWTGSEAESYCEALRSMLINSLPGMSAAPWEWDAVPA